MKLEDEIKQKKFSNTYQRALININFTSIWLMSRQNQILKPYNVSIQQFNILRILKGQHPGTVPLKLLTERMIDRMSNTSRLVEKLKKKGLVDRSICPDNRRQVDIIITQQGISFLEKISKLIDLEIDRLKIIDEKEAGELNRILDKLRDAKEL
jgi:DNA-binding MarR family transcriptional regulator